MKKVFLILSMALFTLGSFAKNTDVKTVSNDDFNNSEIISQEVVEDFDNCYLVVTYQYTETTSSGTTVSTQTFWYDVPCPSEQQE